MDAQTIVCGDWSLRMSQSLYENLHAHLFPGDGDEHGAVIEAGLATLGGRQVLLARRLWKAQDGVDWLPGHEGLSDAAGSLCNRAYPGLSRGAVGLPGRSQSRRRNQVEFSSVDLATHKRGITALLDVMKGVPVGALVFAEIKVAGDIWTADGGRHSLREAVVIGPARKRLTPAPRWWRRFP